VSAGEPTDPWEFSASWPVRFFELDANGHVNNAVYLNWAEQLAIDHAEAAGFGRDFNDEHSGGWVVREHRIAYHRPAVYGDRIRGTTHVESMSAVKGVRRTVLRREPDGTVLVEATTDWVWVRSSDGRPARIPAPLRRLYATRPGLR
jgi:acyl-CoA thioester hydrolase